MRQRPYHFAVRSSRLVVGLAAVIASKKYDVPLRDPDGFLGPAYIRLPVIGLLLFAAGLAPPAIPALEAHVLRHAAVAPVARPQLADLESTPGRIRHDVLLGPRGRHRINRVDGCRRLDRWTGRCRRRRSCSRGGFRLDGAQEPDHHRHDHDLPPDGDRGPRRVDAAAALVAPRDRPQSIRIVLPLLAVRTRARATPTPTSVTGHGSASC